MAKRLISLFFVLLLAFGVVSCKGETKRKNKIDIYIIAGQSNAVGHTKITDRETLLKQIPQLKSGFDNVLYASCSRSMTNPQKQDRVVPWQKVTLDLGRIEGYMGPEVGMAKVLSAYYRQTDADVGLIKFGHGGTSLLNHKSGANAYGNWVSPSYAAALRVSYEETDITGKLYRDLCTHVRTYITELIEVYGYTEVRIKGIYWMQGETDRKQTREYQRAFQYFATDIRNDLSDLVQGAPIPIFIGTLSLGYNLVDEKTEQEINRPFIEMQKQLAESLENCYIVDNSAYMITEWIEGEAVIRGSDKHHWNQAQMLAIGENAGNVMLGEI